ncbi:MAG: CAP domain-containing protein [Gammaproteobacteria bacterium]
MQRQLAAASRLLCAALLLAACSSGRPPSGPTDGAPAAATMNPVADSVNRYRERRGLAPIPVSPLLNEVAAAHVADLEANYRRGRICNMHSWSSAGDWSSCCYTADHAKKECMWRKPREITGGRYTANGYEIVAYYSDPISAERALQIWQLSDGHHIMILNQGQWWDNTWRAMGAAMGTHYAVVWFGEDVDPSAR